MPVTSPYTLIVVDMQPAFDAAYKPSVIVGVTREILAAKQTNSGIIVLEYYDSGDTIDSLLRLLKGYPRKSRVTKSGDNGCYEVINTLRRRDWSTRRLRVCGVNTDCCVWATVEGLLDNVRGIRIEVVKDACEWSNDRPFDWRRYMRHPNLKLV